MRIYTYYTSIGFVYCVFKTCIYKRERIYSYSYSYYSVTFLSHCYALLKKLILFYHFWTCQRHNITSLVYKNLRKVLYFIYGFSEILQDMPGCVVDFWIWQKDKAAGKLPLFVNYKTVCSPFFAFAFALSL